MQVSKKFIKQRKKSLENITSPEGILLRTNRSIQVEGAFGVIKENYKFRQFLLRGNRKVQAEIVLIIMAYWCYVKITDTLNLCFLVKSAKCTNWSHLFHGLLDNEPLMA